MIHSHLIAKIAPIANPENIVLHNDIRVTVLANGLFRIEKDEKKQFCDKATQSIWFRNMPKIAFTAKLNGDIFTIKTVKATLRLKPDIMSSTVSVDGKTVTLSKIENLPGAYRSLDRCNGGVFIGHTPEEVYNIKLEDGIVSKCGVGLHDDTKSLILDEDGRLAARDDDQLDIYVFAHGNDYRGALRDLFTVSGNVPLIPKYAFGNWWSRYHDYTETEYLHILDKLAQRDVPLTVATIDMDWHWSTTLDQRKGITASGKNDDFHGGAGGWTGYSWNTDLFPDYKSFLQKIKDRDLKITLNLHPAQGVRYFEDMYEDMAKAMGVDPATEQKIPFDFTSDDFINAYFDIIHKPYERDGVEFWWIDWQQGTKTAMPGLDPLWALNHYHTLDNAQEHLPLILSRYCGIGSHRYPLGFSGDTHITWESLEYIPYFTAMGTNAGYTWWSHDIGGHMAGYKDDELYTRYIQFGAFNPINRLHCCNTITITKEPVVYMNGMGLIAEEFLRLRHRMIPFLYSASYDTRDEGKALVEPMYYMCPTEKEAYKCHGQYLFGDQMIVAPVTKKSDSHGLSTTKVWLPKGKWTDIFTGDEYEGNGWTEMTRWTDTIPVLAKEGGFFVLDGRRHTNSTDNSNILEVMAFNGNGEYVLHEDKGEALMNTKFVSEAGEGIQKLTITTDGDRSIMPRRTYKLAFKNIKSGKVIVTANGKPVCAEIDDAGDYMEITLANAEAKKTYVITVEYVKDRRAYRNSRITYVITRLEGVFYEKDSFRIELEKLEDAEAIAKIDTSKKFSVSEKKRLKEAW